MEILTSWILWLPLAVVSAVIFLYRHLIKDHGYWESQGVRVPSKFILPIIGTDVAMLKKKLFDLDVERMEKFGKIYGTYFMGNKVFNVSDPEIIKQILVKDFHYFVNRQTLRTGLKVFDCGVIIAMDDDWKRIRSVISPTFSSGKIRKMVYILKDSAEKLKQRLFILAEKGEPANIKDEISKYSIQVIGACAFGINFDSFDNPNHPFIQNSKKLFHKGFFSLMLFLLIPKIPNFLHILKEKCEDIIGMKFFHDAAIEIIKQRRNSTSEKKVDFLQLMVDAQEGTLKPETTKEEEEENRHILSDNKGKKVHFTKTLDEDEVISQCTTFLLSGHDTIASTLSLVAYNLAKHPDIQEKVLQEIDDTWERHGDIDYDIISHMTYLDAVISETLRLQTVLLRLQRQVKEDYEIPNTNIVIPKNALISIPIYALHHDPDYFPEPNTFDPDRFLPENKDRITPYSYLPFGDGPRNCVARRFALMEVKICLAYIMRHIKFAPTTETIKPLDFFVGFGVLQCKRIMVQPKKRETNN